MNPSADTGLATTMWPKLVSHYKENTYNFGLLSGEAVISHQVYLLYDSEADAGYNCDKINVMKLVDSKLFSLRLEGNDVFSSCRFYRKIVGEAAVTFGNIENKFEDIFNLEDRLCRGMYQLAGLFWVSQHNRVRMKV